MRTVSNDTLPQPAPASNASSILQTILHAKYLFAKSNACVFRVLSSSDYAAGWARGDTAANVNNSQPEIKRTRDDVHTEE
ncbi:hypothetical protein FVEN_g3829 [Fusarium venenatum]|nr:hypothetical protein FVEN_g3829 [Fusarium venenatum]